MLRLLSYKAQELEDFWKLSKPCHVDIHWIAPAEYYQMSTYAPGFLSFFRLRVKGSLCMVGMSLSSGLDIHHRYHEPCHNTCNIHTQESPIINIGILCLFPWGTSSAWSTGWRAVSAYHRIMLFLIIPKPNHLVFIIYFFWITFKISQIILHLTTYSWKIYFSFLFSFHLTFYFSFWPYVSVFCYLTIAKFLLLQPRMISLGMDTSKKATVQYYTVWYVNGTNEPVQYFQARESKMVGDLWRHQ